MPPEDLLVEGLLLNEERESDNSLKVVVAGAGAMGHGLALLMARAGHEVILMDLSEEILGRATALIRSHLLMLSESEQILEKSIPVIMDRIHPGTRIKALSDADLVIESISEDPEAKRAFYAKVEAFCGPDALWRATHPISTYSNLLHNHFSSGYALATSSLPLPHPARRDCQGAGTLHEVIDRMRSILSGAGQKPVVLEKCIPSFSE